MRLAPLELLSKLARIVGVLALAGLAVLELGCAAAPPPVAAANAAPPVQAPVPRTKDLPVEDEVVGFP